MAKCKNCGAELTSDDIGATLKFVSRAAEDYSCVPCLAKHFSCTEEYLRDRIVFLKTHGCTVFPDHS